MKLLVMDNFVVIVDCMKYSEDYYGDEGDF